MSHNIVYNQSKKNYRNIKIKITYLMFYKIMFMYIIYYKLNELLTNLHEYLDPIINYNK